MRLFHMVTSSEVEMSATCLMEMLAYPRDGHGRILIMLEGYFDESGIHAGAPACIVAGYYADPSKWAIFESAWKEVLRRERIKEFHAKVFFGPRLKGSLYEGWDESRWTEFLGDLLIAIVESGICPVGASLVMEDWKRLSLDERKFLTGAAYAPKRKKFLTSGAPGKPYFVPFQDCITRVATSCAEGEKAHFFFAQNGQLAGYAVNLYQLIQRHPLPFEDHLGDLTFTSPRRSVHLQAADLLCYLLAKHMPMRLMDKNAAVSPYLKRAMTNAKSRMDFPIYNKNELLQEIENSKIPFDWYLQRRPMNGE